MTLIMSPFEKNIPLKKEKTMLTSLLSTDDLPKSYRKLLVDKNGGYMKNMRIPTNEPTSDGLDYGLIHYIFGLHGESPQGILHQQRKTLPDYFIVFSAVNEQLFTFDFSNSDESGEPAIRYLDLETDNWQIIAPNFHSFLRNTTSHQIEIPVMEKLTLTEAEHALLLAKDSEYLENIWLHLEDIHDKQWLFKWLAFFSNHSNDSFRKVTLDALETQLLYFRLQLPGNAGDVLDLFLSDDNKDIQAHAESLRKELVED